MDFSMLEDIVYWNWLVLAVVLVTVEILVAGTFFLWMAISALAVGLVLLVLPSITWQTQLTLFAIFSIVSIILSRIWLAKHHRDELPSTLNRRGSQYIGRHFTLTDPIVDGVGRLNIDDTVWRVSGPDLDSGAQVIVEGMEGTILRVKQT
ncbi:inner membrane protein YbbJ [bacterium BMS3Bbin11]|nr:inner membrane protein YbbJ [bacterium BMS3Abin11]GBE46813.1 inner membrane protein YbbJ [bacterium BMS3Bbin11]GMT39554.1 MAG: membrane protein [bacterium]HDZ77808.1 NfeD family protein [Gammaproteobacteria bacterium]